jgi:hypothetical protein
VAFRFSDSTAIAAGTFNTYVIHPKWLVEVGLLKEGTKVKMLSDFRRPGIRYSAEDYPVEWDIRPDRVTLKTVRPDPNVDCGAGLATIIEHLPWTPLGGVGVNAEFVGTLADIEHLPRERSLPECKPFDNFALKQRTMHVGFARGPHVFNIQIAQHEKIELSVNVHTELNDKGTQKEISELALETCRNFFALRNEATDLAKRLFGVELSYEQNSD